MAPAFNQARDERTDVCRLASLMTLKFAPGEVNHTAYTIPSSYNKIHRIPFTALHSEYGREQTKSALTRSVTCEERLSRTTTSLPTRHTGFHTA